MTQQTMMAEESWLERSDFVHAMKDLGNGMNWRQLRLLACRCCRLVLGLIRDPRGPEAVDAAERYADGDRSPTVIRALRDFPQFTPHGMATHWATAAVIELMEQVFVDPVPNLDRISDCAARAAREAAGESHWEEARRQQVSCLCDLQGRRFYAVTIDEAWRRWKDGLIPAMAQAIYEAHRFDDLPILADALEDAGCDNRDILAHCRAPRPHGRGCWVVDALLGKE
jgi:hypothetical protein